MRCENCGQERPAVQTVQQQTTVFNIVVSEKTVHWCGQCIKKAAKAEMNRMLKQIYPSVFA
jgi:hypothetical protein